MAASTLRLQPAEMKKNFELNTVEKEMEFTPRSLPRKLITDNKKLDLR